MLALAWFYCYFGGCLLLGISHDRLVDLGALELKGKRIHVGLARVL